MWCYSVFSFLSNEKQLSFITQTIMCSCNCLLKDSSLHLFLNNGSYLSSLCNFRATKHDEQNQKYYSSFQLLQNCSYAVKKQSLSRTSALAKILINSSYFFRSVKHRLALKLTSLAVLLVPDNDVLYVVVIKQLVGL